MELEGFCGLVCLKTEIDRFARLENLFRDARCAAAAAAAAAAAFAQNLEIRVHMHPARCQRHTLCGRAMMRFLFAVVLCCMTRSRPLPMSRQAAGSLLPEASTEPLSNLRL